MTLWIRGSSIAPRSFSTLLSLGLLVAATLPGCGDDDSDTDETVEAGVTTDEGADDEADDSDDENSSDDSNGDDTDDESTSDDSTNDEAGDESSTDDAAASDAGDGGYTPSEGPWGCYMEEEHQCSCEVHDEAACDGADGIWTEGCQSCEIAEAGAPTAEGEACYMPESHTCDCALDEAGCTEAAGIWTDGCECAAPLNDAGAGDSGVTEDAATPSPIDASATEVEADSGATPDASAPAALACYMPGDHGCDCALDEAECADVDGIWTEGCGCGEAADAGDAAAQ